MSTDNAEILRQISELKAQNEALKAKLASKSTIKFKVSEKGAVSVYGLGRFPVTLYRSQWDRLVANVDGLKAFIAAHASELTSKDD